MSFHVLAVTKDSSWHTTPEAFSAAMRQAWPDAELRVLDDRPSHCLAWSVKIGGYYLDGSMDQDHRTLVIYGGVTEYASFACWYRTRVPPDETLYLYSDDFDFLYEVKPETTPTDIIFARTGQPTWG